VAIPNVPVAIRTPRSDCECARACPIILASSSMLTVSAPSQEEKERLAAKEFEIDMSGGPAEEKKEEVVSVIFLILRLLHSLAVSFCLAFLPAYRLLPSRLLAACGLFILLRLLFTLQACEIVAES
jgi:hypothetical protein